MDAQFKVNPIATEKLAHDTFIESPTTNKTKFQNPSNTFNGKLNNHINGNCIENNAHYNDLCVTPEHKTSLPTLFPSFTYIMYVERAISNLLLTVIFDWTMPFFHPFNFLLIVTIFPSIIFGLVVVEAALHISFWMGLGNILAEMSKRWGKNLTPVNWWDPRIFSEEVNNIVKDGIIGLDKPLAPSVTFEETTSKDTTNTRQTRIFDIDIAETLLLMSAIVYERDDMKVREAHKTIQKLTEDREGLTHDTYKNIHANLHESEKRIREQAEIWNLEFTSLSELNSLGGPFAGMFWSEENNFIVVVFKGTTPTNFEDFLVDAMIQRVDARSYVFGEVHEGFYTSLFPAGHSTSRGQNSSPYITIIKAIRETASKIREKNAQLSPPIDAPVNLWVTGHSLGAALSTLFYARLLNSPADLGPNCILRDGYMYGTPAIGDADFAAEFSALSNTPFDRQNTLWRIIDDTDIITKLPPGFDDLTFRRFINKLSVLNYAHVGEGIRFFQDGRPPVSTCNLFENSRTAVFVQRKPEGYLSKLFRLNRTNHADDDATREYHRRRRANGEKWYSKKDVFSQKPKYEHEIGSPLIWIENILPTFFSNHLPIRYFEAMQRAR
ncbi:13615_t:CDS:2, partial [Ambispora gerdemannii]